jgi:hypothetical protein
MSSGKEDQAGDIVGQKISHLARFNDKPKSGQIIVHSSKDSAYNAWAKPESTLSYDYIIYTDGSKMDEKVGCAWVFFRKEDQVPYLQQTIRLSSDTRVFRLRYWKHPPLQQNFQAQQ